MVEPPLAKPDHLVTGDRSWLARSPASAITFGLGLLAFIVVAVSQREVWSAPDWRISVPAFAVTGAAAAVAIVRSERAYPLWLVGLGLAAAGLVLGWFLMLAVVMAATALLILILHAVM